MGRRPIGDAVEVSLDDAIRGHAEALRAALGRHRLCERCLGRLVARAGRDITNEERGRRARELLCVPGSEPAEAVGGAGVQPGQPRQPERQRASEGPALPDRPTPSQQDAPAGQPLHATLSLVEDGRGCAWCRNVFHHVDGFVARALSGLEGFEVQTLEVATHAREPQRDLERGLADAGLGDVMEPLGREVNREVGRGLCRALGATCDHKAPHARVHIRLGGGPRVEVEITPLYVYGRYRKYVRTLPQSTWPCRECRGAGCEACDGKGARYTESVETVLAEPLRAASCAEQGVLHAAGREDLNVRMLGRGRPFVMELVRPRRRSIDLAALEPALSTSGRVRADGLRPSRRREVQKLKTGAFEKTYVALLEVEGDDPGLQAVERALAQIGAEGVRQQTPHRAMHRRADCLRRRRVLEARVRPAGPGRYLVRLRTDAGLYVKELCHGDRGRTVPSIAGVLGRACRCAALDVLAVHGPRWTDASCRVDGDPRRES